jgi:hypothetical protein
LSGTDECIEQGRIFVALRMELHSNREWTVGCFDGLNYAVSSESRYDQASTELIDGLVM